MIFALVFLPASPFATTFPVTKIADTNGSCTPGNCSLREAIDAANTNPGADDVPVPAGFYLLTLGQLVVSDDVSIAGAGQTNTIIDGNTSSRIFAILSPVVVEISGIAIQNGFAFQGGGIYSLGTLTVTDSTVSGNNTLFRFSGGNGGGIYAGGGTTIITNSAVSGNTSSQGGGISNQGGPHR